MLSILPTILKFIGNKNEDPVIKDDLIIIEDLHNIDEKDKVIIVDDIYNDLDIFVDNSGRDNSVYSNINHTKTKYGDYLLRKVLKSPTTNTTILTKRQNIIKYYLKDDLIFDIEKDLEKLDNDCGSYFNFCISDHDPDQKVFYDMIYYNYPIINIINKSNIILSLSNFYKIFIAPSIAILTPVICIFAPFLLAKIIGFPATILQMIGFMIKSIFSGGISMFLSKKSFKEKMILLFTVCAWLFYYVYGSYQSVLAGKTTYNVIKLFTKKVSDIQNLVSVVSSLKDKIGDVIDCEIDSHLQSLKRLLSFNVNGIFNTFFKGNVLVAYNKLLKEGKKHIYPLLKYIAEVDLYYSIAKLYNSGSYQYPTYLDKTSGIPIIKGSSIYHPSLHKKPITNRIRIDGNYPGMLITGPNMGGKSTYIKSVIISIIFSQTLGIVACSGSYSLTPYDCINTCLKIPDSTGYVSQFEAEMYNNIKQLDELKELEQNKIAISVIDEIFTTTNSLEGVSAGFSICKKMASYKNVTNIVTTHYPELCDLEKVTGKRIRNYRFRVNRDKEGNILFPYKIERGISEDHIALELLKKNDFDEDILKDANKKCAELRKRYLIEEKHKKD
jgi:hypothetical protein